MQKHSWLKFIHLGLILMVLCCASVLCLAQSDRGAVSGMVTDPTGSGIVGAKVTVTNIAMGTQNSTVTTGVGTYTIPELAAGEYICHGDCTRLQHGYPQRNHRLSGSRRHESTCNWRLDKARRRLR